MNTNDYFTGMIIDNTNGQTTEAWLDKAIRSSIGADGTGELPEEIGDLFTVTAIDVNGETRVIVDWAK